MLRHQVWLPIAHFFYQLLLALIYPRRGFQVLLRLGRLLYRLLRALASLGLLNETPGRRLNLTERGAVLRTDAPRSLRYMAMLEGGPEHWAIWKHVPAMVRDGRQNAFMREYGKMAFDHARANPDGYGAAHLRCVAQFQHGGVP